jgi:phospholipase/carboxylesterase
VKLRIFAVFAAVGVAVVLAQPLDPLQPDAGDFLDVDATALGRQADSAYQAKGYLDAARLYLEALRAGPVTAGAVYNLACCYGLLGRDTLAARFLERAQKAGFSNVEHIRRDPDFDKVRQSPVFAAAVDSIAARAATADSALGRLLYSPGRALFPVRIHLPADFDPAKKYPLVIGLHGYGDKADNFTKIWKRFDKPGFIFAAPETPYPFVDGGDVGYSWGTDAAGDTTSASAARLLTEEYVLRVADAVAGRYGVDKTFLLGFSQGCGLAYEVGIRHSRRFAGIICFGGWLDTTWVKPAAVLAAKDLPVFSGHAKDDRVVEYKSATEARAILKKAGYRVEAFDFIGGHRVPPEGLLKAQEWMKKQ